eukprot:10373156-Heterocapsa_arctica.AAC.1
MEPIGGATDPLLDDRSGHIEWYPTVPIMCATKGWASTGSRQGARPILTFLLSDDVATVFG